MGGFEGGCSSTLALLACRGLRLCGSSLLMLLLLGLRGLRFLSSLAAGWLRSLSASEDSSMYAKFSPKKSSSWQLAEEALLRGGEGRRMGRQEGSKKGVREERWRTSVAGLALQPWFGPDGQSSDGARLCFSSAPSFMLHRV